MWSFTDKAMYARTPRLRTTSSTNPIPAPAPVITPVEKEEPEAEEEIEDAVDIDSSITEDIEVDEDVLESFGAYIPDDCAVDGVSREDLCKALYKSLSESTSDADAVNKLETYVGAAAGDIMKMIKDRGLYSDLRDIALM